MNIGFSNCPHILPLTTHITLFPKDFLFVVTLSQTKGIRYSMSPFREPDWMKIAPLWACGVQTI